MGLLVIIEKNCFLSKLGADIDFFFVSVLREDYFVRVSPSAASLSKSNEVVEVTSGNSLVLRCEVSRSALASHLIVDSWQPQSSNRLIRFPSHQNHYKGNCIKSFFEM